MFQRDVSGRVEVATWAATCSPHTGPERAKRWWDADRAAASLRPDARHAGKGRGTHSVPGSWPPNWLQGVPKTDRPRPLYSSKSVCRPLSCGVNPQAEAVFTTSVALAPATARSGTSWPLTLTTMSSVGDAIVADESPRTARRRAAAHGGAAEAEAEAEAEA